MRANSIFRLLRLAALPLCAGLGLAQTGSLTVSPASLDFTYQVNDATLPAAKPVQVSAPSSVTGTVTVVAASTPIGWLTATPDTGRAPFTVSVSVNPTGLAPGSYTGTVTVDTNPTANKPVSVRVTLSIRNPPSVLSVSSNAPGGKVAFDFVTGATATNPASYLLSVASTGDTIPFTVTAGGGAATGASSWARVNGANQYPSTKSSGVALAGSSVPITVTVDPIALAALNPGSYTNTITITGTKTDVTTISVTLVVSAGAPSVTSIYPKQIVAAPTVNPTITIYGDNFFLTSVVTLKSTLASPPPPITLTSTLLSRKVLRAVIPLAAVASPDDWLIVVSNPPPPSNPAQQPASYAFKVISATQPAINAVVNAASYLGTAVFAGTGTNPVTLGQTSVSPRELIAIFGQNLGPSSLTVAQPAGTPYRYDNTLSGVTVTFNAPGMTAPVNAPLIMVSSNQINAVVPSAVVQATAGVVDITVNNGSATTAAFQATVVDSDPGIFTFDGLGKGGAAVLNFDALTNLYTINTSKDAAPKNSTIIIYATGMGEVSAPLPVDGEVGASAIPLKANTVRVDIDSQPCVVSYAGATPGAVTGLTQINAIVPPTVKTGQALPITVSVGDALTARRSQPLVTIAVK